MAAPQGREHFGRQTCCEPEGWPGDYLKKWTGGEGCGRIPFRGDDAATRRCKQTTGAFPYVPASPYLCMCAARDSGASTMIYAFDEYELDTRLYELRRAGALVQLEPKVFDLLAYLIEHGDRLVPKS